MNQFNTICAISTPHGVGGIAIIRISGDNAFDIAQKITSCKVDLLSSRIMHCTNIHYFSNKTKIIDNVMIAKFVKPNSFTGENVVELYVHGGLTVQNLVLTELFTAGAIQADAGEFTYRAFLNGKIDLTEAETISDIINAKTKSSLNAATNNLNGQLSKKILKLRHNLINIAAKLFVDIDFGEEQSEHFNPDLSHVIYELENLLSSADNGIISQQGLNVAIVGAPNVGKSSILNALLGEERAIVTEIPGTTRDIIREYANINGHLINFIDTAGIRNTNDKIEQIGVMRTKETAKNANLLLVVIDNDNPIFNIKTDKPTLIVRNKCDIEKNFLKADCYISAKTGEGIHELCQKIVYFCHEVPNNAPIITNTRQKNKLTLALSYLNDIKSNTPLDSVVTSIENSISSLSEIIGENVSDEIISEIFSKFCVGK